MSQDPPRFDHPACSGCTYLGRFKAADLYHCTQGVLPTVIARYGNDGPDYTSGLALADHEPALGEARTRAVALSLPVSLAGTGTDQR